jgi:diacylglycerol kinase
MKPSFLKSVSFALNGLKLAWHEKHFKIHIVAATLSVGLGFLLNIDKVEWFAILICIGAVLSLEMFNTAIEHLVDLVEPNYNPKAGAIKDLVAGAVLVFSIISAIIGTLIFGKYILDLLITY